MSEPCEAYEDLMSRAEYSGRIYISDVAAEVHLSEDEVTAFALKHLPEEHVNEEAGTVSEDGASALRAFLSRDA